MDQNEAKRKRKVHFRRISEIGLHHLRGERIRNRRPMPPYEKALLVNILGHATGTVIFGIFLALFLRDRAGARLRGSWLTIVAAALALIWNAGSLVALLTKSQPQSGDDTSILASLSFSALSLLPAVLLHISLRRTLAPLRISAYLLSAAAVVLHISEHWSPSSVERHGTGLLVITLGFGVLTIVSASVDLFRGRTAPGSRLLGSMSLAIFSMSFLHFGSHAGNAWSNELFFHHAGLPLAIFVLLQDYRFLLVDAFLRFLASALLAGFVGVVVLKVPLPQTASSALHQSLTLGLFCGAMLVYAALHSLVQSWLTRSVFRRPNADESAQSLRLEGPQEGPTEYLAWCLVQIAKYLAVERIEAVDSLDSCGNDSPHPAADHGHDGQPDWVEAMAPLNGSPGSKRLLLLGRRRGGRRYLSEDYAFLGQMASVMSERLSEYHAREMQRVITEAELKALQSQINPHFLFNTLNTIYGTIPRSSPDARKMVRNLSDIFRYALQPGHSTVSIEKELEIVRAYLEIEQLRLGERLTVEIEATQEALHFRIPMLTIQPIVENAVKHAIAVHPLGGIVGIRITSNQDGGIRIAVSDTGSGGVPHATGSEIGLASVRRRLELQFGSEATVEGRFASAGGMVTLHLPGQPGSCKNLEFK